MSGWDTTTVRTVIVEGIPFSFSVSRYNDNELVEICVAVDDYADADASIVFAFDRGGLTLLGDTIHLAVDGDEMFVDDGAEYRRDLERDILDRQHEEEWLAAKKYQL